MMRYVGGPGGEFGTVLISRGWEVGGGEERSSVGTVAQVAEDIPLGDEQRTVIGMGADRIRIDEWLEDDPYPQAVVSPLLDAPGTEPDESAIVDLIKRLSRLYALASELGADTAGQDFSVPAEPSVALWRLCSLVPAGPHDRQRLLEMTDGRQRAALLAELVGDATTDVTLRLAGG
jgi:Lon protease-like protein